MILGRPVCSFGGFKVLIQVFQGCLRNFFPWTSNVLTKTEKLHFPKKVPWNFDCKYLSQFSRWSNGKPLKKNSFFLLFLRVCVKIALTFCNTGWAKQVKDGGAGLPCMQFQYFSFLNFQRISTSLKIFHQKIHFLQKSALKLWLGISQPVFEVSNSKPIKISLFFSSF